MVSKVGLAFEVPFHKAFDRVTAKQIGVNGKPFLQSLEEQRSQWPSQPLMCRNIESDLLPFEDCRRKFFVHQLLEQKLLVFSSDFQMSRELSRKFHDPVVQKGRPHFDRMRHTHAIAFGKNVVGEKVSLIEPEIRCQIVIGRR